MRPSTVAVLALISLLVFVGLLIGTCMSKLGLMICVCVPTLIPLVWDVAITIGFAAAGGSLL